jgi:hypothetical protein
MIPTLSTQSVATFQDVIRRELDRIEEEDRREELGLPLNDGVSSPEQRTREAATLAILGDDYLPYALKRLEQACPGAKLEECRAVADDPLRSRQVLALTIADMHVAAYSRAAAIEHSQDPDGFVRQAKADPAAITRAVLERSDLGANPPEDLRQAMASVTRDWVRAVAALDDLAVEDLIRQDIADLDAALDAAGWQRVPVSPAEAIRLEADSRLEYLRLLERLENVPAAQIIGYDGPVTELGFPDLLAVRETAADHLDAFLHEHAPQLAHLAWVRERFADEWEPELSWRDERITHEQGWQDVAVALVIAEQHSDPDDFTRVYENLFAVPLGAAPAQDLLRRLGEHYPGAVAAAQAGPPPAPPTSPPTQSPFPPGPAPVSVSHPRPAPPSPPRPRAPRR